ncbi:hypothetical protein ABH939_005935 [Rhodococcus sp. 27YEA6]
MCVLPLSPNSELRRSSVRDPNRSPVRTAFSCIVLVHSSTAALNPADLDIRLGHSPDAVRSLDRSGR